MSFVPEEEQSGSRVVINKRLQMNMARLEPFSPTTLSLSLCLLCLFHVRTVSFWKEHGINFALFWLTKTPEEREEFVRAAVPDIKEGPGEEPTDLLLPEMNMAVLLAEHGRGLIAVMQTRASMEDSVEKADLAHVRKLDAAGQMPIFSGMEVAGKEGDAFEGQLAFVLDDGRVVVCETEQEKETNRRCQPHRSVSGLNIYRLHELLLLLTFIIALLKWHALFLLFGSSLTDPTTISNSVFNM